MTDEKIIEAAAKRAGAIAPLPGDDSPTITVCLLRNKLFAAARRRGVTSKKI